MKIVFLDGYTINPGDLDWSLLQKLGEFVVYDRTSSSQIEERASDAEVLIVNKTPLKSDIFAALPKLKLICVAATGFDNIDIQAARKYGIPVCNCKGYSSNCVAQMIVSLILEVADSVGSYTLRNHEGDWIRSADFCYTIKPRLELARKKMAIIGFGNIGKTVAAIMHAFQVDIYAVTSKSANQLPEYVQSVTLNEAFRTCDIVSLNCPLTAENAHFVNKKLLQQAKPGLILVNTARGALIHEDDVAEALRNGCLGAYCADVLCNEPPRMGSPILNAPHAFITPHIAWNTPEARIRILQILAENIQAFVAGEYKSVVN